MDEGFRQQGLGHIWTYEIANIQDNILLYFYNEIFIMTFCIRFVTLKAVI